MLLKANHLSKSFTYPKQVQILKDVSFTLELNQSIAIMGASGIGKTTLLHILGSLEDFDSGELLFNNHPIQTFNQAEFRNQQIGFIFQSYQLLDDFTTLENLLIPSKIARKNTQAETLKAEALLKDVGLYERKDFPVRLLSGGEKQRVAIARSFMNDPQIILADEPTGNLDSETSSLIHRQLLSTVKKWKKSLIVVTHDRELAQLCDQIYVLNNGTLQNLS